MSAIPEGIDAAPTLLYDNRKVRFTMAEQTKSSHARYDPLFHFFVLPALIANIVILIVWHVHHRYVHAHLALWAIFMSVVQFLIAFKARTYPLGVQDRVIRLEERLRLSALATPSEMAELDSLTVDQYVGLRFASNPEVVELARKAVRENLTRKQIKENVKAWRADHDRI